MAWQRRVQTQLCACAQAWFPGGLREHLWLARRPLCCPKFKRHHDRDIALMSLTLAHSRFIAVEPLVSTKGGEVVSVDD